jgi:hypothetical protein
MEASRSLSIKDKELIKELVQKVHNLKYINLDAIYEDIECIISNMSKEELDNFIKNFNNPNYEEFYDNPIIEIRRIILAGMFVEKDLSEMECKIDNKIIEWLYTWITE